MNTPETQAIREEDVEARTIERRTFLGRFGAMAGLAGFVGWTTGCGSENQSDPADADSGDPADFDPTDPADSDSGDPADSD